MRTKVLYLIGAILLCVGCNDSSRTPVDGEVYKVDLDEAVNPFDNIFSRAEIISLETSDSCLVAYMQKVYPINGKLYIYDFWLQNLNVFDHTGRFVQRIGKRGQGPGE